MSNHYDDDDWGTPEEIRAYNARYVAEELRASQQQKKLFRSWINTTMENMTTSELAQMYAIAQDIKDYKTFFEVIRKL